MLRIKYILTLSIFASVLGACTKESEHVVNVYLAASKVTGGLYTATTWKNQTEVPLTVDITASSIATDIAADGNDVYVSGRQDKPNNGGSYALYWKNGTPVALEDGYEAFAIAVASGSIYVAGIYSKGACYWKNGKINVLNDATIDCMPTDIAVVGNDVYVSGLDPGGPNVIGKYWKNGVATQLQADTNNIGVGAITVVGNDVYVAGTTEKGAVYWKNGVITVLGSAKTVAIGIASSGSDVFICGIETTSNQFITIAKYWRNGVGYTLTDGIGANSIAVNGNDVYVAGFTNAGIGYWKNGQLLNLPTNQGNSFVGLSICVQ